MSVVLHWARPQPGALLTTDTGHAMVRMQRAVFVDRDGATGTAGQRSL